MIRKQYWLLFLYAMTMISVVIEARFFLSQAMFWLLLAALFSFKKTFPYIGISPEWRINANSLWQYRAFLAPMLFFIIVLVSGLWSFDKTFWLEKVRVRLPFIILPIAFAWLPCITKRHYYSIFYGMLWLTTVVMAGVLYNYYNDYERITETLLDGKNIPVPMNHIRFSLLLAFTIAGGFILYYANFYWRYRWEKYLILVLSLFLFAGIHILSVRSGIIALYGTLALLGFRYFILLKKQYIKGFLGLIALCSLPFLAHKFIPSLQKKVTYGIRDYNHFKQGKGKDFSDAERFGSIMVGWAIGKRAPLLGCGYGDLPCEIENTYYFIFPEEKEFKLPHNQFIITFAGLGIFGISIFIFAFLFPLFYKNNYQDWFFLALHVVIFFSFLVEATLETQIGVAIYSFFLGLGLNYNKKVE
jgi:O-antigen ligase